jgi:hypothetical protein
MNIVLQNPTSTNYYLVGIWKESDCYIVKTKWLRFIDQSVELFNTSVIEKLQTLKEAKRRCRVLVKNKIHRQGLMEVESGNLAPAIMAHFAPPLDSQMTPEEFLKFVVRTRTERYVIFKENTGMENFFDIGIQYVGYITDDPHMLEVYDKNGNLRSVLLSRMDGVIKTEDCLEAEKVGNFS